MRASHEIARLPATELLGRMERRELSPVEVTEACLAQVERYNRAVNAVVTVSELALEEARAAEKRLARGEAGPLAGLPVGIKDVTPVAGVRTTYGSPLFADHIPAEDALVVRRLREAGAVILGKTNTPEFAAGANTYNAVFGPTRNPWDPGLSAGGSTGGGAAALATGMVALAEGTDLGGSLRVPASFCGVVGLRPSPGLVPTHPTEWPWDTLQVTGPLARTVADVALMLQAVAGPSPLCPVMQPAGGRDFRGAAARGIPRGLRLAYCPELSDVGVEAGVERSCREAAFDLRQAGASVEEVPLDLSEGREAFLALRGLWMVVHHRDRLDRLDALGENLQGNIRAGLQVHARQLASAERARGRIWHALRELLGRFDALLTPCAPVAPFPVEESYPRRIGDRELETYVDWIAPTFVLSLSGLPVASVPCGLDEGGLPVGLQVAGPAMGEETVLAVAAAVQEARPIGLPPLGPLAEGAG